MMRSRQARVILALTLVVTLVAGVVVVLRTVAGPSRTHFTAYFANSNGIFPGDGVEMLGVRVGRIETIEPQPSRAKISFWVEDTYPMPADVKAVIISPQLITSRAIALTPVYSGGPKLAGGAVIPQERTAVPMEFDDLRNQLGRLAASLQPTADGGTSPLGALVNTTADNLRGQGAAIRDAVIKLSQTLSALGDQSGDLFGTIHNLAVLISALHSSSDLMRQLNGNLAAVTGLIADDPDEVGEAIAAINGAASDVQSFAVDNREAIGTASDKLASITTALNDRLDDIKQTLHVTPNAFANFINIYKPSFAALMGALPINNFSDTIQFICGAIQAASRMNAEQSAKLCVQYLAPIVKNRQYNFPPIGVNPFVAPVARPNELTYSEDRLRPDYRPTPPGQEPPSVPETGPPQPDLPGPLAAEMPQAGPAPSHTPAPPAPVSTDPAAGLPGIMAPPGSGS